MGGRESVGAAGRGDGSAGVCALAKRADAAGFHAHAGPSGGPGVDELQACADAAYPGTSRNAARTHIMAQATTANAASPLDEPVPSAGTDALDKCFSRFGTGALDKCFSRAGTGAQTPQG